MRLRAQSDAADSDAVKAAVEKAVAIFGLLVENLPRSHEVRSDSDVRF